MKGTFYYVEGRVYSIYDFDLCKFGFLLVPVKLGGKIFRLLCSAYRQKTEHKARDLSKVYLTVSPSLNKPPTYRREFHPPTRGKKVLSY